MAIRRGTLYRVSGLTRAHGLLVVTNDEWNEAPTQDLIGALVYTEPGPGWTPIPGAELHAGPLMSVPKVDLLEPLVEFSPERMKPVGEAISEILGLDDLRGDPPRAPAAQAGPIDYPRWSSIYYAGPRVGALSERKRYLVISHDQYNRAVGGRSAFGRQQANGGEDRRSRRSVTRSPKPSACSRRSGRRTASASARHDLSLRSSSCLT